MAAVTSKAEILSLLQQHRRELEQFGVERCGVFGSFARREQTDQSDVDILVELTPGKKNFDNFMRLSFFLEELFGRPVHLVTRESLSPHIGPHILQDAEYATSHN